MRGGGEWVGFANLFGEFEKSFVKKRHTLTGRTNIEYGSVITLYKFTSNFYNQVRPDTEHVCLIYFHAKQSVVKYCYVKSPMQ